MEKWLTAEFLRWTARISSWSSVQRSKWRRPYELLQRADDLLRHEPNSFDRADCLGNLKRALNHRLQLIDELYFVRSLNSGNQPKGLLELLAQLGVARPLVLKNLMAIRNDVEHRDTVPPDSIRCGELSDTIWYFLRSTDEFSRYLTESIDLSHSDHESRETHYGAELHLRFGTVLQVEIAGWFPDACLLEKPNEASISIKIQTLKSGRDFRNRAEHAQKLNTDVWVIGELTLSGEHAFRVLGIALNGDDVEAGPGAQS